MIEVLFHFSVMGSTPYHAFHNTSFLFILFCMTGGFVTYCQDELLGVQRISF